MKLSLRICMPWIGAVAIAMPAVVEAQPTHMTDSMPGTFRAGETNRPPLIQALFDTSFTAAGPTEFLGTKSGDSDAFNARLSLFAPLSLSEKWMLPLRLGAETLILDSVPGVPVPEEIHTLTLSSGLSRRLNDEWMITGTLGSTLYKFNDVGWNDVGLSGSINATWRSSPSVSWRFGLMASPDSDIPVLPIVGVDWQINEEFNLRLLFPQPRLTYQPPGRWKFFAGMNLAGTTFRASESLGNSIGQAQYNDALGTYRDIRLGGGFGFQWNRRFSLEAEAGYSVSRQIDYTRVDEQVEFGPAPYFRLGLRVGF